MNKKTPKTAKPAEPASVPDELFRLIDLWNGLPENIIGKGNRARRDPPAKELLAAWKQLDGNPDLKAAFADLDKLFEAIRAATFCHREGWFTISALPIGERRLCYTAHQN